MKIFIATPTTTLHIYDELIDDGELKKKIKKSGHCLLRRQHLCYQGGDRGFQLAHFRKEWFIHYNFLFMFGF